MYKNLVVKLMIISAILIAQSTLTSAHPGITVDVNPIIDQVVPPETAIYSVTVVSSSTETERVTLSIVNPRNSWSYSFKKNDFDLAAGETETIELQISVPAGTPNGKYFHDIRGFAVVPGFEGLLDEDTTFTNVLTAAIPEFPTIALPVISAVGIMLVMCRRKRK